MKTNRRSFCVGMVYGAIGAFGSVTVPSWALVNQSGGRQSAAADLAPAPPISPDAPLTPTVVRLLRQLTLDEKLSLVHLSPDPEPDRIGNVGYVPGVPRLGIPARRDADALGIQVIHPATALPSRIGLGAGFDRAAVYAAGRLVGSEGRALGVDLVYAPEVDLTRLPNWGRNNATYGEDPFLTGQLGIQEVAGIQSVGLMAQVKHLAFYDGQSGVEYSKPGKPKLPTLVDDQTAHELYLKAFEYPITEAVPSSVMASYQGFQITPIQSKARWATDNPMTLRTTLRDRWKFTGFAESDYDATHSVHSLLSGLDQDSSPDRNYFAADLGPLVDPSSKTYNAEYTRALDNALAHVLYQYERFGLLVGPAEVKHGYRQAPRPNIDLLKERHARITERLAEEAAVLLKNDDAALPLKPSDLESVAVIGPTATQVMIDGGQPERARGFPDRDAINTLQMLRRLSTPAANFIYAPGIDWIGTQVPASAFASGLVRTETGSSASRRVPTIDYGLDSPENDLKPGVNYRWAGRLIAPADDTYYFWIQSSWLDAHFSLAASVKVTIDGVDQKLVAPGVPVATYPAGIVPPNGTNQGFPIKLRAGTHSIVVRADISKMGYYPIDQMSPIPVAAPVTFRLSWSRFSETLASATAAAKSAKTVLLFVDDNGLPEEETGAGTHTIVGSLAPNQDTLIEAVTAANPNTIVVMSTGNPVLMPWIGKAKAVLENWYPGQEGATAIAKLLLGMANPSGKTPITWPVDASQTPFAGHPERFMGDGSYVRFSEGLFMGYRWYDQHNLKPLFPFGHGLSYTTFSYSDLHVLAEPGGLAVTFTISNDGPVKGAEVPQVYLGPPSVKPGIQVVPRKLAAFDRIELAPRQRKRVTLHVSKRELSYWSTRTQGWVLPDGARDIYVGSSSRDVRLQTRSGVRGIR